VERLFKARPREQQHCGHRRLPHLNAMMDEAAEVEEAMGGSCSARMLSRREKGTGTTTHSRGRWLPVAGAGFATILLTACVLAALDGALRPRELERPTRFLWRTPNFLRFPAGACNDGWLPITSKSDCEAAARELILSVEEAVRTQFKNRPSGCYLVRSAKANRDTLWLNEAPHDSPMEKNQTSFGPIDGWIPQPLCKKKIIRVATKAKKAACASTYVDDVSLAYTQQQQQQQQ